MKAVKKAIPVDVYQFGVGNAVPGWFREALNDGRITTYRDDVEYLFGSGDEVEIITFDSVMHGSKGDYVLHRQDDIWIVRESIFKETYEMVE